MKTNPEIHITTDGKITYAVLKQGGKVLSRSEAKCHPDDKFDFETGAKIALDRLEVSQILEVELKDDFKVGDIIECIAESTDSDTSEYPPKGTQGEVIDIIKINGRQYSVLVRWSKNSTLGDGLWWISSNNIRKVEQPKYSFKVGDIVEFVGDYPPVRRKTVYPPKGTRGEIVHMLTLGPLVKWEKGKVLNDEIWWCAFKDIKKVEQRKYSFKVGDRVRFRSWDDMKLEFCVDPRCPADICIKKDKLYFSGIMSPLCGTYATIKSITYNHRWGLSEVELTNLSSNMVGTKYMAFSTVMFEPASTKRGNLNEY